MKTRLLASRFSTCLVAVFTLALAACAADRPSDASAGPPVETAARARLATPLVPGPDGKIRLSEAEWRARLTSEQFSILREAGTERPFSSPLAKPSGQPGAYLCAGCDLPLFDAVDKFDSGTGWPSFTRPLAPDRVLDRADNSHGMRRVENLCVRCDGHLGHVFTDGPAPTGLRYCINGVALRFVPAVPPGPETASPKAQP